MNYSLEKSNADMTTVEIDSWNISDYETGDLFDTDIVIRFIPAVIVFSVTFIIGIIGNVLVIFTIKQYKNLHSITNIFLLSLATADLLLIIACVPLKFMEFFSYYWALGEGLCKLMHYTQNVSGFSSVLNLTAISLERYLAIVHPLKSKHVCTKSRAIKIIISIWVFSFLATIPVLFGQGIVKIGRYETVDICNKIWSSPYDQIYEVFKSFTILFVPLIIMVVVYACMLKALWKPAAIRRHTTLRNKSSSFTNRNSDSTIVSNMEPVENDEENNFLSKLLRRNRRMCQSTQTSFVDDSHIATRKQMVKMLIIVILIFFICWAPVTINNLLVSFGLLPNENIGILWSLRIYFSVLCYFNSCVNPIVYAFMSKYFREGFKYSLERTFCKKKIGLRNQKSRLSERGIQTTNLL